MPLDHPAVQRVQSFLSARNHHTNITALADSARTAAEAAAALGIQVGQVASSIIFGIKRDEEIHPLLVVTSGQHRVDTSIVAAHLGVEKLVRADADFVRSWSGFAIGGVSPFGWESSISRGVNAAGYPEELTILIDAALNDFTEVWAAAGHPHTVFPTSFAEISRITQGTPLRVGQTSSASESPAQ